MMRLTQREKILAITSAVFITVWSLFAFLVKPAIARAETLNRVIYEKKDELGKLYIKSKEYALLRNGLEDLYGKIAQQSTYVANFGGGVTAHNPGQEFELLPLLESLIQKHSLDKKVVTMKQYVLPLEQDYQETIVEIKLQNLTLNQLINFLCKAESLNALTKVRTLHIQRNPSALGGLDVTVEIHTIKMSQGQDTLD
jgi:hypothetical protein